MDYGHDWTIHPFLGPLVRSLAHLYILLYMRIYEYVSATGRNYNVVLVVSALLTIGIDDFVYSDQRCQTRSRVIPCIVI